jgi:hypothetical protein
MNPGRGKTHRGCAARCLSGGLTPLFSVPDAAGTRLDLLLTAERGEPFPAGDRWAGRPVRLRGRIVSEGDLWLFEADPRTLEEVE